MSTIEAHELAEHAAEIVRQMKNGETIRVLEGGSAIATITPATPTGTEHEHRPYSQEEAEAFIIEIAPHQVRTVWASLTLPGICFSCMLYSDVKQSKLSIGDVKLERI